MKEHEYQVVTPVESFFEKWSILAALLVLPAVVLQIGSTRYEKIGELLSVGIWIFFFIEVLVMLKLAPDNLKWARAHRLELLIVIFSCPVVLFISEDGTALSLAPLLLAGKFMRLFKFGKLIKIGKIFKTLKIVSKDGEIPKILVHLVRWAGGCLGLAIIGMVVGHDAHNLLDGLTFWIDEVKAVSVTDSWLVVSGASLLVVLYFFFHYRDEGESL